MGNIYEEIYQTLLAEGYEDDDAVETVNYIYDNYEFEGVELLDENKFRAIRALATAFGGTRKGWVNMQRATKFMSGGGLSPAMTRRTAGKAVNLKNVKTPRLPVSGQNVAPPASKVGPAGGYTNPLKGGPASNAASQPLLSNRSARASQILQKPSGLGPDAGASARSRLTGASRNPDAGIAASRRLRGGMPREATPAKPPVTPSAAPAPTPTAKGGPLATTGKSGGLQKPASVQQVNVKDITPAKGIAKPSGSKGLPSAAPKSAVSSGTKNVSTAITRTADKQTKALETAVGKAKGKPSGAATNPWNQFPKKAQPQMGLPKEGPSSRLPGRALPPGKQGGSLAKMDSGPSAIQKVKVTELPSGSQKALPPAKSGGSALPTAAAGGALVKSSGGGLVKGASGGKAAVANNKLTSAVASAGKGATKGGRGRFLSGLAVGAAAGLLSRDSAPTTPTVLADREEPKADKPKPAPVPPAGKPKPKPEASTGKPKPSPAPAAPTGPRPMTKIDTDVMDLMNMRARSLDRQGRTKDAEELRANIEKKYGGRKPYGG